ncbi:FHA domain-containing protein [Ornithinimicrobium humiphilum]|uniref:Type III secretion system (T3SS) inner membrane Yop/YscD-like protein n=1 Tax=Ornithinimicrobium humiphilum TaxID=125288 RepID=A0A543KJM9_9MICO|nr:FHA domain-containing protein [Ornithinimicrobium humiphilum]TQM95236.1 type III secretion system (T3SS) inner membrane Yop/YscD-like protein [Ornithinimicrobium humiphilum]
MGELTLNLIRLGVIVLLWAFVFSIVGALRGDLYGTRVVSRSAGPARARESKGEKRRRRNVPTHLVVTEGSLRGTSVPLHEGGLLVGRNPECTLVLTDDYASGRHLRIYPGADAWYADDLGSTNGTLVNGQRIDEGARLDPGAQIRIGQTVLELRR